MSATARMKSGRRAENGSEPHRPGKSDDTATDVFTLAEAAAYLRISEQEVLNLVSTQGLPGRNIGDGWRFFKTALQDWLSVTPAKKGGLLSRLGAIKDDPYAEQLLKEIYKRRGRPETEEG